MKPLKSIVHAEMYQQAKLIFRIIGQYHVLKTEGEMRERTVGRVYNALQLMHSLNTQCSLGEKRLYEILHLATVHSKHAALELINEYVCVSEQERQQLRFSAAEVNLHFDDYYDWYDIIEELYHDITRDPTIDDANIHWLFSLLDAIIVSILRKNMPNDAMEEVV